MRLSRGKTLLQNFLTCHTILYYYLIDKFDKINCLNLSLISKNMYYVNFIISDKNNKITFVKKTITTMINLKCFCVYQNLFVIN